MVIGRAQADEGERQRQRSAAADTENDHPEMGEIRQQKETGPGGGSAQIAKAVCTALPERTKAVQGGSEERFKRPKSAEP
ncbi:hypothetical protein [Aureimonas psammosilenae]|uniref:hypothetical protein n=1 Tax=Aureimonas psammosilenae TaxID=2495496 RepID=UPI001260672D|nr:hypothetical protein [Aureimonas psammosilenae]